MILTRNLDIASAGGDAAQFLLRPLEISDASGLAAAYRRNRGHLAPWEPARADHFFSTAGQAAVIQGKLGLYEQGTEVPWVLSTAQGIMGMFSLSGIVRGPFLNANLGYWVDEGCTGKGVASGAVAAVVSMATKELGLHRIQAATLAHNTASQAVLKRSGFERIGLAPSYLQIAGEWQDHVLFQRILF
ncbi:GNAT family N-acetyltransferase [Arthrobacter sp. MYb23]|uniref:GNAT family N-acetyltransferase n=1 Tax=unclassified Arthrobacter TaxID=235627 RepID=UPI000CFABA37|nr:MULTISPECIES: GNAT family N-acetyltransferase [unclassified Arthrobacter]PRB42004.1 GNAT family N-acetyltransferase [Arthrobacter sp. MYb51]PRB89034.1 GNAT family N-acetyltransferase [Arthrobacter sp. MYb23]